MNLINRIFRQNSNVETLLTVLDLVNPYIIKPKRRMLTPTERQQQIYMANYDVIVGPSDLPDEVDTKLEQALQNFVIKNTSNDDLKQIVNKIIIVSPSDADKYPIWWKNKLRGMPSQIREALIETKNLNLLLILLDREKAYEIADDGLQTKIKNIKHDWLQYWDYLASTLDQLPVVQDYPIKGLSPNLYAPMLLKLKLAEIDLMTKYYDLEMKWDIGVEYEEPVISDEDKFLTKDELITNIIENGIGKKNADEFIKSFFVSSSGIPSLVGGDKTGLDSGYYVFRATDMGYRIGKDTSGAWNRSSSGWTV